MLLPVRIGRREHIERVVGINTDASSEEAAKILEQAEATGGEIKAESSTAAPRTGSSKSKSKDVEVTGERRPFKGMWQDSSDSDLVKTEPISDEEMADAEPLGNSEAAPGTSAPRTDETAQEQTTTAVKKTRTRRKKKTEPALQTEEDKAEYARFLAFQQAARRELGPEDDAAEESREESAYIFQLPPQMPNPLVPDIKKETTDPVAPAPATMIRGPRGIMQKAKQVAPKKIKSLPLAHGAVGRIRVHESGRTTLLWGSDVYELSPGNPARFVEEVADLEKVPGAKRVVANEGGEGSSFGRIKGKFVASLELGRMV
ncbi:hypothetical protein M011DRAFT_95542 [Sporormia fimetaria CBS 119925]|uniref:Uncharacterized protein n=1 Tax=Sporormia fimetaria CBS 119925 TaxID=1340428 RepID=A0A6A6V7F8_9PLEO|nr:hypothetical protein M011DRAFT_95542 [Sporormia fimetaria CBS 119925]